MFGPALTEVRTVLSRARTARNTIVDATYYGNYLQPRWDQDLGKFVHDLPPHGDHSFGHPDAVEMVEALDITIEVLKKWQK
jgi:hypothetical protein